MFSCSATYNSFVTLWTITHGAMEFSSVRGFPSQEPWSGLPFPSPGDLPNPGIKPTSALAGIFFTADHQGSNQISDISLINNITGWKNVFSKTSLNVECIYTSFFLCFVATNKICFMLKQILRSSVFKYQ